MRNNRKLPFVALFAALLFGFSACSSLVDDLNADLNNPGDASAELTFTGVELANITVHEGYHSLMTSIWTGHYMGVDRQWADFQVYNPAATNFDGMWNNAYYGVLRNARLVLQKTETQNIKVMSGMTKVLMAHTMGTMTALYGDIPFTEAARIEEFPNAKYDGQLAIYAELQKMLDEAIGDLATGVGIPRTNTDIHFNGDPKKWIEVAYTLKARFHTDTRDYPAAAAAAQKGISTGANSLVAPHGLILNNNQNLIYSFLAVSRTGDAAAATASGQVTYLARLIDPTSTIYRGNAKTDETARFNFYYLRRGVNVQNRLEPNTVKRDTLVGFMSIDAPFPMVSFQENKLMRAELAARANNFADALKELNEYRDWLGKGGYINATTFARSPKKYLAYGEADFLSGGLENANGSLTKEEALLREILEERYVTFYCQTVAWNDERRTRTEKTGIKLTPNNGNQLPWRFIYSQNELNGNALAPKPDPGVFKAIPIYNK